MEPQREAAVAAVLVALVSLAQVLRRVLVVILLP
jgi:hypothetical protein